MAFNQQELPNIKVSSWSVYLNRTEIGMVSGGLDLDEGSKAFGVKTAATGKANIKMYNDVDNAKVKFKIISSTPERLKMIYNALQYRNGALSNSARSAKELKDNIWTFVPKMAAADGSVINDENNMSIEAFQLPRGVASNGLNLKTDVDKPYEYAIEVMGMPDLNDYPEYPCVRKGSLANPIVLPNATGFLVNMTTPGAGGTVTPTAITCTGLTGFACTWLIVNGALVVTITNGGSALPATVGTYLPLTITGGTFTTAPVGGVFIG